MERGVERPVQTVFADFNTFSVTFSNFDVTTALSDGCKIE